jgi:hypothetical protein
VREAAVNQERNGRGRRVDDGRGRRVDDGHDHGRVPALAWSIAGGSQEQQRQFVEEETEPPPGWCLYHNVLR